MRFNHHNLILLAQIFPRTQLAALESSRFAMDSFHNLIVNA
jgi:hypothetical protein